MNAGHIYIFHYWNPIKQRPQIEVLKDIKQQQKQQKNMKYIQQNDETILNNFKNRFHIDHTYVYNNNNNSMRSHVANIIAATLKVIALADVIAVGVAVAVAVTVVE